MTVKTTAGPVTLERPKLRGTDEAFASRLLGKHVTRTGALESLTIAGYVRGLSTRDVEACLADALGAEAALSKSTVSRVCEAIRTEFDTWRARRLAGVDLEYLYLDASHFRLHDGARAEPVMVAYGITSDGAPRLLALEAVSAESHDAVVAFLRGLVDRGLRPPLLTVTDGAPGLISAVEQVFPQSLRQRCVIHRLRNLIAKVSKPDQAEVESDYWAIFDDIAADPDDAAVAEARRRAGAFETKWRQRYPSAADCVTGDLDTLTVHLRLPHEHHKRIRHKSHRAHLRRDPQKSEGHRPPTRRTLMPKPRVGGARPASRGWRGVDMNPANVRLLQQIRRDLLQPHAADDPQPEPTEHDLPDAVTPAA